MNNIKFLIKIFLPFILLFIANICYAQNYYLQKCDGDKQLGLRGIELKNDFVVRLFNSQDNPVSNEEIVFYVAKHNEDSKRSSHIVLTDKDGYARTKLGVEKNSSDKLIVVACTKNIISNPVYFTISVLNKNWILLMIC